MPKPGDIVPVRIGSRIFPTVEPEPTGQRPRDTPPTDPPATASELFSQEPGLFDHCEE